VSDWYPFETRLRDGKDFLAGCWRGSIWLCCVVSDGGGILWDWQYGDEPPTHWTALPEPPVPPSQEQE
jgi:hypothetical protein